MIAYSFFSPFPFFYCKSYFLCFATASTRTWSSLIFILFSSVFHTPTLPTFLPHLPYLYPTYPTFALTSLHYPLRTCHPPRNPHILFALRNSFYIAYTPPDVFVAIYALPRPLLYAHPTLTHAHTLTHAPRFFIHYITIRFYINVLYHTIHACIIYILYMYNVQRTTYHAMLKVFFSLVFFCFVFLFFCLVRVFLFVEWNGVVFVD